MPNIPPDMRSIFAAECEDYLSQLTDGFLALEQEPTAADRLDQLFRVAHSLKGTSRVMGCMDLGRAAHALEDLLDRLRSGKQQLEPSQYDALSGMMNQFWALLAATLEDGDSQSIADELLASLERCEQGPQLLDHPEEPPPKPSSKPPSEPSSAPPAAPVPAAVQAPTPARSRPSTSSLTVPALALDVLKVPTQRLDTLIAQVGELLAIHQRMHECVQRGAELRGNLEEITRRPGRQGRAIGSEIGSNRRQSSIQLNYRAMGGD